MKTFLIFFAVVTSTAFGQTGLIAHKSHSGTALTYTFADPGNFGAPSPSIVSIKWINDSTVVQKMDRWGGNREDTIYNHPIYSDQSVPLDSIRKMYWHDDVEYLDTAKRLRSNDPEKVKQKNPTISKPAKPTSPSPKMTEDEPAKKKKKSIIWFIVIGGGTFTGMMLIGRRTKLQPAR